jgi:hypothetical protein
VNKRRICRQAYGVLLFAHVTGFRVGSLHSRALYYRDGLGGQIGNWVDRPARQMIRQTYKDENHRLFFVKVRVAGSNPVFRSRNLVF